MDEIFTMASVKHPRNVLARKRKFPKLQSYFSIYELADADTRNRSHYVLQAHDRAAPPTCIAALILLPCYSGTTVWQQVQYWRRQCRLCLRWIPSDQLDPRWLGKGRLRWRPPTDQQLKVTAGSCFLPLPNHTQEQQLLFHFRLRHRSFRPRVHRPWHNPLLLPLQ